MNTQTKKGFTLIELLVVIAILAVLATAVVIILNPAQVVKQGRDSTRISDLSALHNALALFLSEVPNLNSWNASTTCTAAGISPFSGAGNCSSFRVTSSTAVTGTGWVDTNFGRISSGSPLSRLPLDPVNDTTNFYAYKTSSTLLYEIDAKMESTKYSNGGAGDVESKDQGDQSGWYEIGNAPGLNL